MTVQEEYKAKAAFLAEHGEKVDPLEFYRDIFPAGSFERAGHPEDAKANAVVVQLGGPFGNVRRLVFDDLRAIQDVQGAHFAVTSAISYSGLRRSSKNARWLYALTMDLDDVGPQELRMLFGHISTKFSPYPCPTYVVNSGHGLHLYWALERPVPMLPQNQSELRNIKQKLIATIWNDDTSRLADIQYQPVTQGFRVVGTDSKLGPKYPVTAYRTGPHIAIESLCDALKIPCMIFFPADYRPRAEGRALEKYRHWGPYVNRALYDWWLRKIKDGEGVVFHHRYWVAHALVVFAAKCNVPRSELKEDLWDLLPMFNAVKGADAFTEDDLRAALRSYREEYRSYPREAIEQGTGIPIPPNKRNGRRQEVHLKLARNAKAGLAAIGEGHAQNAGRPDKAAEVKAFLAAHPDMPVAKAARELGVARNTIYKYRNNE